jgi:hypothetical protein
LSRFHLYLLCAILTALSLGLFLYKALALRFPLTPGAEESIWQVEARVTFAAKGTSTKIQLFLPQSTPSLSVVNESFISRGYGLTTKKTGANRRATWSTRKARGRQTLYYRSVVRRVETRESVEAEKEPTVIEPGFEGSFLEAAESLIAAIREQSADLDSFLTELLRHLREGQSEENVRLLLGRDASTETAIEAAVRILAQARVPARSVHGILLEAENRDAPIRHWLEVYDRGRWRAYDFAAGGEGVPEENLAWWRGPEALGEVQGGQGFHVVMSVAVSQEEAIRSAIERARFANPTFLELSLFRLPVQTQSVYRVLLLIPLGAFLVVIFRNVVGISTFGTFMPVLIALAFRETQLLWGIALFSLMVGLGLAFRFYLDRLKLLLVPRLASVLIMVVVLMVSLSIVTNRLGLERALSVALFPMVILTMTIERMSIVWEERGAGEALKQGIGSLLVATLSYLLMTIEYVEHVMFVFPEVLLFLLAGTLLLGRYTGYRLVEIHRFKTFRGS